MNPEPLTPLLESAARTGKRFFSAPLPVFNAMCAAIDAARGHPAGVGTKAPTLRAIPEADKLPSHEGNKLVAVDVWRMSEFDRAAVADAITAGQIAELLDSEYAALLPPPPEMP